MLGLGAQGGIHVSAFRRLTEAAESSSASMFKHSLIYHKKLQNVHTLLNITRAVTMQNAAVERNVSKVTPKRNDTGCLIAHLIQNNVLEDFTKLKYLRWNCDT